MRKPQAALLAWIVPSETNPLGSREVTVPLKLYVSFVPLEERLNFAHSAATPSSLIRWRKLTSTTSPAALYSIQP